MTPDVELLERCEIAAWDDLYDSAPEPLAHSLGLVARRSGPVHVFGAAAADVLAMNRAVGAGLEEPLSPGRIDSVRGTFADARVPRFVFQVAPGTYAASARALLESRGFAHHNNWVRLYHRLDTVPHVESRCTVREIGAADAARFAEIAASCFGWPLAIGALMTSGMGRPAWKYYFAESDGVPVATAALFAFGDTAWMGAAATLPEHRGLGAQKILVQRRLADAKALGCSIMAVETAELTVEKDAPSYRNMLKLGFLEAYLRPNFIFPSPAASPR